MTVKAKIACATVLWISAQLVVTTLQYVRRYSSDTWSKYCKSVDFFH